MKVSLTSLVATLAVTLTVQMASSQTSQRDKLHGGGEFVEKERGAHHRTWERTEYETVLGRRVSRVHRYQELATGMHYFQDGQWRETREEFEITADGYAVAERGQHKVRISPILNDAGGTVEVITPTGQRLISTPIAIGLYDRASGNRLWAGEVTNSVGRLIAPNVIEFTNAFSGFQASIRHVYQRDGFHQDVILSEQLDVKLLRKAGFSLETSQIEIWTEFFEAPAPRVKSRYVHQENDSTARANMADPDVTDEDLDFGDFAMPTGAAYLAGDIASDEKVEVNKRWLRAEGRTLLVESVPLPSLASLFSQLPPASQPKEFGQSEKMVAKTALPMPVLRERSSEHKLLAKIDATRSTATRHLVLDYATINTSQTNYVFQSDTTYYLSGNVSVFGTNTTFEGGTVIKYASNVVLTVNTPVTWQGEHYRPVVMISKNDNSAGENISGSTGNTTHYSAGAALYFNAVTANANLVVNNLRVNSAKTAVAINGRGGHVLNNLQLVNCGNGFALTNAEVKLRNALCYQVLTNFTGSSSTGRVEHLTSHIATWLNNDIGSNLFLTNCLLVAVTNLGSCTTQDVSTAISGSGIFETVGAGAHYLTTNSVYRNIGTTNVNASLIAALRTKTTYPPIAYSNTTYSASITLVPQAQRDTDLLDLGFHYDPIDYAFGGTTVATNLTFQPGTRVAWFRTSSSAFGIRLNDSMNMSFNGRVDAPCAFVRNNTVQEQANANWTSAPNSGGAINSYATEWELIPTNTMRFTRCSALANEQSYVSGYNGAMVANFRDCELYGGQTAGWVVTVGLTNCLLHRAHVALEGGVAHYFALRNCTMRGGGYWMNRWPEEWGSPGTGLVPVTILDTIFDGTTFYATDDVHKYDEYTFYDYNAFQYGGERTDPVGVNDYTPTTFEWWAGPIGNFYLPSDSPLIGAGSLSDASQMGLYHFTTQTDQTKEGTSVLDLGYHYVAVANGFPIDTDGDGMPDYLEDADGDGNVDGGETSWLSYNSLNGLTGGSPLLLYTPLKK